MRTISPNVKFTALVDLVDINGTSVLPSMVSARLIDQVGVVIAGSPTVTFTPGESTATVEIPAAMNDIGDLPLDVRTIELEMLTAVGEQLLRFYYVVAHPDRLIPMVNSFMTYAAALALTETIVDMDGFIAATEKKRQIALTEAYVKLVRHSYEFSTGFSHRSTASTLMMEFSAGQMTPTTWRDMTADTFANLPAIFRDALLRAQVIEANAILSPSDADQRRNDGVRSEKIGESMIVMTSSRPLTRDMSRKTFVALRGFIKTAPSISRS